MRPCVSCDLGSAHLAECPVILNPGTPPAARQKTAWHEHCDASLGGVRDPGRHCPSAPRSCLRRPSGGPWQPLAAVGGSRRPSAALGGHLRPLAAVDSVAFGGLGCGSEVVATATADGLFLWRRPLLLLFLLLLLLLLVHHPLPPGDFSRSLHLPNRWVGWALQLRHHSIHHLEIGTPLIYADI
ncbi:unnamed protein product [Prorocentrum cordatum]|uniref:Fatty acid hydroxylase domain-containing protein n=1 Tax=Prorocentrum cordatum TaxID=2364126 RepID=A0ABN9VJX3_9DINO|nr:unnamed protein product [Polarella glacialis]